jgi:hypothetical protein
MKNKYSLRNPVYIGDTIADQKATELVQMDFIHAAYGFGKLNKP